MTAPVQPPRYNVKEQTPMERLADLAKRVIAVPKSELPSKRKGTRKRKRHS